MLCTIHVLDDHVANQIAAGEVVERPSSVVKELVENALDAGATRVQLIIEDGGKSLIRIVDNGCGMNPQDALLSLKRHATSKVKCATDLQTIATLGFRGEALPSIRSVARFQLRTRTHDAVEGIQISADGDQEPVREPIGCSAGTDISVRDLFFNVPARRKFLRRDSTEIQRISELINQMALGWPGVHFSLQHNGRKVSDYPSDSGLKDRIRAVLGKKVCQQLIPVKMQLGEHKVAGYAGTPSFNRPNNRGLFTFINGRFIRDRVLQHAVTQAYGPLLERGRYPVCVLYLNLPYDALDVNVHPAKSEVRFVNSGSIHSLMERAIKLSLADAPNVLSIDSDEAVAGKLNLDQLPSFPVGGNTEPEPTAHGFAPHNKPPADAEQFEFLSQLAHRYWVCKKGDSLCLINQHALGQQIHLNELRKQWAQGAIVSQRLLFPARVTLPGTLAAVADSHNEECRKLGFELEHFGGDDWVLSTLPQVLAESGRDGSEALMTLLKQGARELNSNNPGTLLASMACHAAWQQGDDVSVHDAEMALARLETCHSTSNCTHSQTVMTIISAEEIEAWMERT